MSYSSRDFRFYAEVVLATSVSVITANLWLRVIDLLVKKNIKNVNAIAVYFILAIIFTGLAISGLWIIFRDVPVSPKDEEFGHLTGVKLENLKPKIIGVG